MVRIAPVALQYNPRTLWFDPGELELASGDAVVVSTEKGLAFGHTTGDIIEVSEEEVARRTSKGLAPVLRLATEEDLEKVEIARQKSKEALPIFKKLVKESQIDMNPVMVEFSFIEDKAIFFFESEDRVDFRDLVRLLAAEFHVRVDMRQIGVRDEARMVGGLGHCGQELCCRRMGGEFCPVSIRMAKEQDLSLNPQKISGVCGRLMCCLRYEYETYKEFKARAPKVNAKITTPIGPAKVISLDVPRERVTIRLEEEGKQVTFPLYEMDEPAADAASKRPTSIGDVIHDYLDVDPFESPSSSLGLISFDTGGFTGTDTLATPQVHHNQSRKKSANTDDQEGDIPSPRSHRRRRVRSHQPKEAPEMAAIGCAGGCGGCCGASRTFEGEHEQVSESPEQKPSRSLRARRPRVTSSRDRAALGQETKSDTTQRAHSSRTRRVRPGQNASSLRQNQRQERTQEERETERQGHMKARPRRVRRVSQGASNVRDEYMQTQATPERASAESSSKREGTSRRSRARRTFDAGGSNETAQTASSARMRKRNRQTPSGDGNSSSRRADVPETESRPHRRRRRRESDRPREGSSHDE